jgi:pSer/pThr/pTyr-binding forkhead associated (FHA) protein
MRRQALMGDPARAGPHLLVRPDQGPERAVALGHELTVGRNQAAGLRLEDPGSSRLHARVRLAGSGLATVEDLGSKNGLRLNGRSVEQGPEPLRPGDELLIGTTRLRFVDPLAEAAEGEPAEERPAGRGRRPAGLLVAAALLLAAAALAVAAS